MLDILIASIFWFFAIFGMIQMFKYLSEMIGTLFETKSEIVIVVTVRNQEENIENIIRSIVWKHLNGNRNGVIPTILVVDMDSTDNTMIILKKLCYEYEFIKVTNRQGYIDFLSEKE